MKLLASHMAAIVSCVIHLNCLCLYSLTDPKVDLTDSPLVLEKESSALPVDIAFVILDLKYNEKEGVKICEMQSGSSSVFSGYDYLNGLDGAVPKLFCELMSKYQYPSWYMQHDICDKKFVRQFQKLGWTDVRSIKELENDQEFLSIASMPVDDPSNLHDYHGVLYARSRQFRSLENFKRQYPGIIVIDAGLFPYFENKNVMDKLLRSLPKFAVLRPDSMLCNKIYSKELTESILKNIQSEFLVIKPIKSSQGLGVIIISRENLDQTLEYLFTFGNKRLLKLNPDPSYSHWYVDRGSTFLVEQFVESTHVEVPQFNNKLFDGTIRAVVMVIYNQKNVETILLEGHWKLPKKSVNEPGSFNERHKSYGKTPHFLGLDPQILKNVQEQLHEGFTELYQTLGAS